MSHDLSFLIVFFFNLTPTTEIYTLSLHDALPIFYFSRARIPYPREAQPTCYRHAGIYAYRVRDRKSTRLNSSHVSISYAVFCLKKKTRRDSIKGRTGITKTTSRPWTTA